MDHEPKNLFAKWKEGPWKVRLLVVAGLIGMALLLFSEWPPSQPAEPAASTQEEADDTMAYAEQIETSLKRILSSVTQEEDLTVWVTLSGSSYEVYATEESRDEQTEGSESGGEQTRQQTSYLVLRDNNGQEQVVKLKTVSPEICGVVVVSRYADDPILRENIIHAVTTSLQISSTQVCVVARGEEK